MSAALQPSGDRADLETLATVARELALRAGDVTLQYFGDVLVAERKSDGTPVTTADREAEALLREEIQQRYPLHSIVGEEFPEHAGRVPIRWILDPIDGTRSFMQGVPLYAVLIGIEIDGQASVGVAHFPALDETVAAFRGGGCSWWPSGSTAGVRVRASDTRELERALVLTTDPERALASEIGSGWRALSTEVEAVRGWGDAYGHALVATGRADVMVDPILSVWDAAPLLPIVKESGGRFTDLSGVETIHGGSGISSNGHLHERALEILTSRTR